MHKLISGALTFRRHVFGAYREHFRRLAHQQEPDTLFITCSDSRMVPNLITSTDPGDLFVVRNIGNLVPPYSEETTQPMSVGAALEYALNVLDVRFIVLCGHSGCGAMRAVLQPPSGRLPNVDRWLRTAQEGVELLKEYEPLPDDRSRADLLSELNVLVQIKHLKTYPCVWQKLESGQLKLVAWFFEIEGAQLHFYDAEMEQFVPFSEQSAAKALS